jgi:hypothetical protein
MYIQAGIVAVVALVAMTVTRVVLAERRDYEESWQHCGIRVSPAYVRAMERLIDPNDTAPFREFVLRPWNPRTWQLWRMAVRIERLVFWETDKNTALELWRTAVKYLLTTALVVGVDQRLGRIIYPADPHRGGRRYAMAYGMIRVTWGSPFGLITLKGVKSKKYWHTPVRKALKIAGMPWYALYVGRTWDITMIAVLQEYRFKTSHTDGVTVTMGILAQTCQFSEDRRMRWWFTILARGAFHNIQRHTGSPWEFFFDPKRSWMPYFGSKGSQPFYCHFPAWIWRLFTEDRETFEILFRNGMPEFRYAPRSAPLRDPVKPKGYPRRPEGTVQQPEAAPA